LEDDSDGEEDTSTRTDGSHEISDDSESTDAHTTESGGNWDVTVEDSDDRFVAETLDDHVRVSELLGDILGGGTGDLNPGLGEEGAGSQDESQVEDGMEGIIGDLSQTSGRGNIVCKTSDRDGLTSSAFHILPATEQLDEDVAAVTLVQQLRKEVKVGNQSSLEDDGDVRGIKELDGVRTFLASVLLVLDGEIDTESLEVDDDHEHQNGSQQVGDVGEVLTVESFLQGTDLVTTGDQQVEKSNNSSFELSSSSGVDGGGGEGLPDNVLTDVGGNKERDTRSKTVSLLQELIQDDDDDTSEEELHDDENGVTSTEVLDITVHTRHNVGNSLTDGDYDTEKFLGTLEESTVFLDTLVDLDDLGTGKQLHDHTGSNNRTDTKFHEGTSVGG